MGQCEQYTGNRSCPAVRGPRPSTNGSASGPEYTPASRRRPPLPQGAPTIVNFSSSSVTSMGPMCCFRRKTVARALGGGGVEPIEFLGTELGQHVAEHPGHEADQPVVKRDILVPFLPVDEGAGALNLSRVDRAAAPL